MLGWAWGSVLYCSLVQLIILHFLVWFRTAVILLFFFYYLTSSEPLQQQTHHKLIAKVAETADALW